MDNPRVEWHSRAYSDVEEIAGYIRRDSARSALRFLDAVAGTVGRLAERSGLGRTFESNNPHLDGLRCFRVAGFGNYLVFYVPLENGIRVVRVLHGARDLNSVD